MAGFRKLSEVGQYLTDEFDKNITPQQDKTISVNPVVAEVATWYEKIRTAMDYREEDVILRAAIERILKRRMLLGGTGKTIAEPLVRELVWARYFPDSSVPESITASVETTIDLYFRLQDKVAGRHKISRGKLNEWIMDLLSSEIQHILNPNREKELLTNFIFQYYKDRVTISDDNEETKDAQVFIAIRRTFAKEDLPLLKYHLFIQLFGHLESTNLDRVAQHFKAAVKKIEDQLNYSLKDKIYTYFKNQVIPFFILEDVLKKNKGTNKFIATDEDQFRLAVLSSCNTLYDNIKSKVGRAVVRGVIFILVTKALFALSIEASFESLVYETVAWGAITLNTVFPPLLMIIVGLSIKTPGKENSLRILDRLNQILQDLEGDGSQFLRLQKGGKKTDPLLQIIFVLLWLLALVLGVGTTIFILTSLRFSEVSQAVFIFFLAIVSFISYRISQIAHMYSLAEEKQSLNSIIFDFLFMPIIHVGRDLTENISKLNLFLFVFDLAIETPFKIIFAFFEQWFLYLRTQREKLG